MYNLINHLSIDEDVKLNCSIFCTLSCFVETDNRYNDFRYTRSKFEGIDGFLSCYKISKGSLVKIIKRQGVNRKRKRHPLGSHCTGNMGPYSKIVYAKSSRKGIFHTPTSSYTYFQPYSYFIRASRW